LSVVNTDEHGDRDLNGCSNRNEHGDEYTYTIEHSYVHADSDSHVNEYAYGNEHGDIHADTYENVDEHADKYTNGGFDKHGYKHTDEHSDTGRGLCQRVDPERPNADRRGCDGPC